MTTELVLAGVQVGTFLILLVQTLKFLGVEGDTELRLGLVVGAAVFTALWALATFLPVARPYVEALTVITVSIMTATLGYAYLVKPLAQRAGLRVTATDIAEEE